MNQLEPEDIEWKFISSMGFTTHHHSKFIDDKFGLEMEKISNIKDDGSFGKAKTYYFITGQEKEYTELNELCKDWNEIKNYDDPNSEIKWVKTIRDKNKTNDKT